MHRIKNREHIRTEKIMKKMKKTMVVTVVALAACVSMQLFAQNTKEDTITFALTVQGQSSVSTSTAANAGNWSDGPTYYKTASKKMTQTDLLKAIAVVQHSNPNYYTSKAKLVLVQGVLSGFFNIDDNLALSYEDFADDGYLYGTFNYDGDDWSGDVTTSLSDGTDTYARLDTGRHFLPVPDGFATSGEYPVGHMQPWGQIFVKDPGHPDESGDPLCENVTYFFFLQVQECYDCFYLSSFISDAKFSYKQATQSGPPCCTAPEALTGKGVDKYYLSLSFDNTINNSYLNPALDDEDYYYEYVGYTGLIPSVGVADGTTPDLLPYVDSIRSQLGKPSPFEVRFTLNGILTYNWQLKFVNADDVAADFVGTASYSANGFGFIGLVCSLLTGSATFSEKIVKADGCCLDIPWYEWWYGPGSDDGDGYFNPVIDQFNPYPELTLPDIDESPYNPAPALSLHGVYNPTAYNH